LPVVSHAAKRRKERTMVDMESLARDMFRSAFPNRTMVDIHMLRDISEQMHHHLNEKVLSEDKLTEARNILKWSNELLQEASWANS